MIKKLLVSATALLAPLAVFASVNLTHLTVDGATNATVSEGSTVTAKVTYNITSSTDVESMSWELVGSGLPQTCENVTDRIANGTFTSTFDIDTTGASEGTWDILIRSYGDDDADVSNLCESTDQNDSQSFTDRITVTDSNNDNQGNTGGSNDAPPSWLSALLAQIQANMAALLAALKPVTPPTPPTPTLCQQLLTAQSSGTSALQSFLMANGQANMFHAAGVYAPTGFLGPITLSALSAFRNINGCM